ncbi:MAG: RNA-directed DNA polymerase [Chloroflexi bacterium]|nr:RNA-directed DNA polymerase [Chloroflexota bacterium]
MPITIDQCLSLANLTAAWEEVAQGKGAAGIDHVTIARWRRHWEERLVNLARDVRANTYRPARLRRFSVPKRSGGYRHLTIPTVTDRVLQRAVLRVVDDLFDQRFLACSCGYRQGRGLRDAARLILDYRDRGYRWVLDADVDECFDSLDHALLMDFVREDLSDPIILRLVEQWLLAGRLNPDLPRGIPLGCVISPLLCNIYLHRLDEELIWLGHLPVRYADDFCVFCRTREGAERAWRDTAATLAALHLQLEPSKTHITHFDEGFDYLGIHFEGDAYSFIANRKHIEIEGDFDDRVFYDYVPDGYS